MYQRNKHFIDVNNLLLVSKKKETYTEWWD